MRVFVFILGLVFLPAKLAFAETIILKNGSVLEGMIEQMTSTDIVIKTPNLGNISIQRSNVESISNISSSDTPIEEKSSNVPPKSATQKAKPETTTNFAPLTPTLTLQESHQNPKNKEWFFGAGLGFLDIDSIYSGDSVFDLTLLGYRFESGFSLSLSTQFSESAFERKMGVPEYFHDSEGSSFHSLKKITLETSLPFFDWKMLGSRNSIRGNLGLGVMEIEGFEYWPTFYSDIEIGSDYLYVSSQSMTAEIELEYSLRLTSFVEFKLAFGIGVIPHEFKYDARNLRYRENKLEISSPNTDVDIFSWQQFNAGLRILL